MALAEDRGLLYYNIAEKGLSAGRKIDLTGIIRLPAGLR
jgi:hypothetical protein